MFRSSILALTVLLFIGSLSCQPYTTSLEKGVAGADETAAKGALRTIAVAQQTYSVSSGGDFGTFPQLCQGDYLDSRFNSSKPALKDYVLTMEVRPKSPGQPGFYSCNADPVGTAAKAGRHFYIDSTSSELHANPSESASAKDPVVQP